MENQTITQKQQAGALPEIKKHTAIQTILFHLVPGIMQYLVFIFLLIPLSLSLGFSSKFGDQLVVFFAMAPIQFGILLFMAKKTTGTYQITKLMPYKEKSKITEYILFMAIILVWALIVDAIISPLEIRLRDGLFSFIPDSIAIKNAYSPFFTKDKIIITACLALLTNGIMAPVTEELYFRGFLLPRINLSPAKAVIVNSVLFSLYHFFSPWCFFSRVLMTLPIYYWVMRKKNIRFSIMAHVTANVITSGSVLLRLINT
jgi:membrane protease YdiL (CAAX protease family)